jgi:large repetitive protein
LIAVTITTAVMAATGVTVIAVAAGGSFYTPVPQPDIVSTYKTQNVNVFPLNNDVDPKAGKLTIKNVGEPPYGSLKIYESRYLIYTPQLYWAGSFVINYTCQNEKLSADSTITFTVKNHPPNPVDLQYTISKNTNNNEAKVFEDLSPTGNKAIDVDTDIMFIARIKTPPSNGIATISANGRSIFYTPNTNFISNDVIVWDCSDSNDTTSATIYITVQNDPPTAVPDSYTKPQNLIAKLTVLDNDYDINGDPIIISGVINSGAGIARISSDNLFLNYYPIFGVNTDSFEYTISDPQPAFSTSYVVINMVNTPPVATNQVITISKNSINNTIFLNYSDPDPFSTLTVTFSILPVKGNSIILLDSVSTLSQLFPNDLEFPDTYVTWMKNTYTLLYTPLFGDVSTYNYIYTVSDSYATATATITVNIINDPPTANDDIYQTTKNVPITKNPLVNDFDKNGDLIQLRLPLGATIVNSVKGGNITWNSNSTVTYNPPKNFVGEDIVTYTIEDVQNNPATNAPASANITVTIGLAPPQANNDNYVVNKGTPILLNVLLNDFDSGGDPFTITSVQTTSSQGSTVSINSNGTLVFYQPIDSVTPIGNNDIFTYTITSSNGLTSTATVSVQLINSPPVAVDDVGTCSWNTSVQVSVLTNDYDPNLPDKARLQISSFTNPTSGTVVKLGQSLFYTPNPGFVGVDTFTYKCTDLTDDSNSATVTITVTNNQPIANDDQYTIFWGKVSTFDVISNDSDPDSNPIVIIATNYSSEHGIVSITSDNKIQFTQTDNYVGPMTFTYAISDWNKISNYATVTLNIFNVPPVAVNDQFTMHWSQSNNLLSILQNDFDNNNLALTLKSVTQPTTGTVVISGNNILFSNNAGLGSVVFNYTISNGGSKDDSAIGTVTITLTDLTPPVATPLATTLHWRTYSAGTVLSPQTLQYTASGDLIYFNGLSAPNNGGSATLQGALGSQTILYKQKQTGSTNPLIPPWNFVYTGDESFTYQLTNGASNSSSTITVTTYNNPPSSNDISISQFNLGPITIDVIPTSSDNDVEDTPYLQLISVFNLIETGSGGTGSVAINNGKVLYSPNAAFSGTSTMNFIVTDGLANVTKSITVNLFISVASTKFYTIPWSANPVAKTYNITQFLYGLTNQQLYLFDPLNITKSPQAGTTLTTDTSIGTPTTRTNVLYKQKANSTASDSFIVSYTTTGTDQFQLTVYITITNTNPTSTNLQYNVHWRNSSGVIIKPNCSDADGDNTYIKSIGSISPSLRGSAIISNGNIIYYPNGTSPYLGNVQFTYTCTDGIATTSSLITVTHTNTAPTSNNINITLHFRDHATPWTINLAQLSSSNDLNGDPLSISSIGSVSNSQAGSLNQLNSSHVRVTALLTGPTFFTGTFTFTFTITDLLVSVTRIVTVNVIDNAPRANHDYYSFVLFNQLNTTLNVLLNDTDPDPQDSGRLFISSTTKGTIISNQIQYVSPPIGFIGTDTFTVTIRDGVLSSTSTVYVTITSPQPVANPDSIVTQWSQTSNIVDIIRNDLFYSSFVSVTQNPLFGQLNLSNPTIGNVTYKAFPSLSWSTNGRNQLAQDSFRYQIRSSYGLFATGTVTINITNVLPLAVADSYTFNASFNNPQQTLNVLVNDDSGDTDAIRINNLISVNTQGSITTNGNQIFYTPKPGFVGTDIFSYTITDSQTTSNVVNVTIRVLAPILQCQVLNYNITKGTGFSVNLASVVTSFGSYPLTYALSGSNVYTRGTGSLQNITTFVYQTITRRSTPVTQSYLYTVSNTLSTINCYVNVDFYNSPPIASTSQIVSQQNKGTRTFLFNILQNWTDPNPEDIPFLRVNSITNTSCATAIINPNNSITVTMLTPQNFTGTCVLPYTVSDSDLNNPMIANSSVVGLLIAIVTNPPTAVNDYVYVVQNSGPKIIPFSTLLANDFTVDIGSSIQFKSLNCPSGFCAQTPYISGNNVIFPNTNIQTCDGDTFQYTINTVGAPFLTSTATVTIVLTNCQCSNVAIDLMFLTDGSGSITSPNWLLSRQFIANVSKQFTIGSGPTQTRVGCIQFSTSFRTEINIYSNAAVDQSGVYNTLAALSQLTGGTATLEAFRQTMIAFNRTDLQFALNRTSVAKVIVILTDGQPTTPCSCTCCECIQGCTGSANGCATRNGTFYTRCSFDPGNGKFCFPCASPIAYTNYINSLKIKNNNSKSNYRVVSLGIGDALNQYNAYGWGVVKQMNYDPNLALQVSWSNLYLAVQSIIDAACQTN